MSVPKQPDAPSPSPSQAIDDFKRDVGALLRHVFGAQCRHRARGWDALVSAPEQPNVPPQAAGEFKRDVEAARAALRRAEAALDAWAAANADHLASVVSAVWSVELQGADLDAVVASPERVVLALTRAPGARVRLAGALFKARYEITDTPINEAEARYLVAELAAAQREGLLVPATSADVSFQRATSSRAFDSVIHAQWLDELVARVVATTSPAPPVLEKWLRERDAAAGRRRERRYVGRDAFIVVALLALRACGLPPQVNPASDALSGAAVVARELGMRPPAVAQAWKRARREGRFVLSDRHGSATPKGTSKA